MTDDIECVLVVRDITRVQYYDYNVNMAELTITAFTDVSGDGATLSYGLLAKIWPIALTSITAPLIALSFTIIYQAEPYIRR